MNISAIWPYPLSCSCTVVPWYEVKKPGCLFTMQETWSQPKSVPGVFQKCCDHYGEMSEMWMFCFWPCFWIWWFWCQRPRGCTLVVPLKLTPCDKSRSHIRFTKFQRRSVLGVLCVVGCYIKRSQWNCCSFGSLASESSASKALGPQSSWSDWKADRHSFRWW